MLESKLNLDFKLVEQARAHAARVADDTQRFIDGCTTVAVERTICRLLGIDGVDASDVPLPSVVVDHLMDKRREDFIAAHGGEKQGPWVYLIVATGNIYEDVV